MGRPKVGRPRTVNMFWVIVFHHPGAVYEYSIISPRIMKDDDVWNIVQSRKGTPVKVEAYCFDNIDDANEVYESLMEEHGRTPLKLKVVDGQVVAEDDEDKKKGKGKKGKGNAPRKNGKATLTANKSEGVHMRKSRDNANSFALDVTYGSGVGDRSLIESFYANLVEYFKNSEFVPRPPIQLPPESQVNPKYDADTQLFIFADYMLRKISPISLRAVGLEKEAAKLEKLGRITDRKSALEVEEVEVVPDILRSIINGEKLARDKVKEVERHYAYAFSDDGLVEAVQAADDVVNKFRGAFETLKYSSYVSYLVGMAHDINQVGDAAARAVAYSADVDANATWKVVNEMLREICGETPRNNGKVTLKSKTKSKVTIKSHDDDHHDHHHHLDLGGSMDHYRDNAGANLRQLSEALEHLSINFPDIMQSIEPNLSFSAVSTDSKDMAFIVCTEVTSKFLPLFLHMNDNRKAAAAAKKLPAVTSEASLKKCLNGLEKIYSELSEEMSESRGRGIYTASDIRVSDGLSFIRNAHSLLTQVEHLLNTNQESHLDWFAGKLGGEFIVNGLNSNRKSIHNHPASSVDISAAINSLLTRLKGGRDNRSHRDNVTFRDFVYDSDYDLGGAERSKPSVIVDSFYDSLAGLFGDAHLDIPDRRTLVVAKDDDQQAAIFADYGLHVFSPMAIKRTIPRDRVDWYTEALEAYPKITDRDSARKAIDLARVVGFRATQDLMKLVASGDSDRYTLESIGFYTAQLVRLAYSSGFGTPTDNNTKLDIQVSNMLKEVCGRSPTPKRTAKK